ncbi:MAG: MarR family transcriptional regulator [Rhodobacteraceae bacterium]|uniref:MarR family winged helix-turn-helix transcriptional regulator n=1 Tax=Amaricoccus sp. B4 TaxID=3368557 RepID=UPI000DACE727|nr:MarR family transcriptional regulator [Paracoccaceae bacterium]
MTDKLQEMPGHLIRRLHQISVAVFSEHVAAAGLNLTSVQYAALSAIAASPGIDQATLAGSIAYDRVTIGGVVDRLVQKGLIDRRTNERDRRARVLHITPEGETVLREIEPVVAGVQRDILVGLSETERATLIALMRKATEAGNELSRAPRIAES